MRISVWGPVIAFTVIGGLTPVFGKLAVSQWPWMTLAWLRFGVAGLLLCATARMMGKRSVLTRRNLARFLGLAALCVPINQFGFLLGLKLANASHAGVFYALNPVLIFWGALIAGQSRFRVDLLAASLLAFLGAVAVTFSGGAGASPAPPEDMLKGDALLLLAIVSWSAFSVLSRPMVQRYGPIETLSTVFILGAILHTPLAMMDVGQFEPSRITRSGWVGAAYLTLITSYFNYMLWYWVIARHDITRVAVVTNCHFVITVIAGVVFQDDPLTMLFVVGCVLILAGILLATRKKGHTALRPVRHFEE